jgi:hypothetical protein
MVLKLANSVIAERKYYIRKYNHEVRERDSKGDKKVKGAYLSP